MSPSAQRRQRAVMKKKIAIAIIGSRWYRRIKRVTRKTRAKDRFRRRLIYEFMRALSNCYGMILPPGVTFSYLEAAPSPSFPPPHSES